MSINGTLMSKDVIIAEIINSKINMLREDLCPLLLLRTKDIELWLEQRAIDKHRTSSRVLRKILRLTLNNSIEVVMKYNAVSLTDSY